MTDDQTKRAEETKLFRKLVARDRLMTMAAEAAQKPLTREAWELQRLKGYLHEWADFQERYRAYLGTGRVCAFAAGNTNPIWEAMEYLEISQRQAMADVGAAIEDLSVLPDGIAMRAALRIRLLHEAVGAKVYRHGRLTELRPSEVEGLADRAELALIPMLKKKGLLCDYNG